MSASIGLSCNLMINASSSAANLQAHAQSGWFVKVFPNLPTPKPVAVISVAKCVF